MEESIRQKKERLEIIAARAIDSEENQDELNQLMSEFGLSRGGIIKDLLDYTFSTDSDNDDYTHLKRRFVLHLHNLIPGSYHQRRQEVIREYVGDCKGPLIDIGFGVPHRYVLGRKENDVDITLADKDQSAIDFSKALFRIRELSERRNIHYRILNMNEDLPGRYNTYLLLDSIEHTRDPTNYLRKTVRQAPNDARFIFALPIGGVEGKNGMHYMEWEKVSDAISWTEGSGLGLEKAELITPNPEVDFFASIYGRNFRNLLIKSRKIQK